FRNRACPVPWQRSWPTHRNPSGSWLRLRWCPYASSCSKARHKSSFSTPSGDLDGVCDRPLLLVGLTRRPTGSTVVFEKVSSTPNVYSKHLSTSHCIDTSVGGR